MDEAHVEINKANNLERKSFYIAGVGASAGGLEALEMMLDHLPAETGIAFVVIQHLSPNYKSFMAELLTRHTTMKIMEIEHNMIIQPNHVYLLPPKQTVTLENGKLILTEKIDTKLHLPIDLFFHSLARDQNSNAIGVILSGTGSDGSKGIQAIKAHGGITIVQEETDAKFDGMPKSAILTGMVDYILKADEIGREIQSIVQGNYSISSLPLAITENQLNENSDFADILLLIKKMFHIDFSYYKLKSVMRRIEKRMGINRFSNLHDYLQFLINHPDEITNLKKDLLIGVTSFFRDPEAFNELQKEVIPQIFENNKESKEIRIWVAACSTGEEAYTLAILCKMYMDEIKERYQIKIFATDIDEVAIEFASQGLYSESAAHSIPEKIRNQFFTKTSEGYQVSEKIRKMIVFAQHNLLRNPPFINLDLISCRNFLIYLQAESQQKLMSLFHFALHSKGYLFLGSSETVGKSTLFNPYIRKWSIYQYRHSKSPYTPNTISYDDHIINRVRVSRKKTGFSSFEPTTYSFSDAIDKAILKEYVSPTVIIDEDNKMIHSTGPVHQILRFPQGELTTHILKLVHEDLDLTVRAAIRKVRQDQVEVFYHDVKVKIEGEEKIINVKAKPFRLHDHDNLVILFFEEGGQKVSHIRIQEQFDSSNEFVRRIDELELELQHTKEYLQITKEELETSNEELQSTNEELIAANEELQSSNEELQSLNEELMTVNTEYQEKIMLLTELTDDMDNLLVSTKIGTIFLDDNLCIRRFTPAIEKEINVIEVDIGRPLSHISHNFTYYSFVEDARQVLESSQAIEKEISTKDGKWYFLRVLPYLSKNQKLEGVVLTFHDITDLKKLNEQLQLLSYAIQNSPVSVSIFNKEGQIEYANEQFTKQTGIEQGDIKGTTLDDLLPQDEEQIWKKLESGEMWDGEVEHRFKHGEQVWESVTLMPLLNEEGDTFSFLRIAENVTEKKHTETLLLESEMMLAIGQLAAGVAHEIRNPLTSLKGFTKLLETNTAGKKYLEIMDSELDRINMIVSELLFLSKPRSIEFEEKNLITIIKDVCGLLEAQANMNNIEIIKELETEKYQIRCVEYQIKQVFINLIKNAIEAMPNGGTLTVTALMQEESIEISIKDTGKGIPENIRKKVGQPFFTTKEKGTGLGLMVTQKIIHNHDGVLTIQSEVNKGTNITIIL
ncbi:chemotaxis protein CheB [Alkalihalobacterium bogoriense]|uniref:chemotaxis protein CheB n=1 Tax=Alkalihalobacterium bogoriense TaxID=246272 RepID=UPI0006852B46|nr:chemotaxis protein CheB [Alkalihalobacterium bogoriense]